MLTFASNTKCPRVHTVCVEYICITYFLTFCQNDVRERKGHCIPLKVSGVSWIQLFFCQSYQNGKVEDGKNVAWSDESRLWLKHTILQSDITANSCLALFGRGGLTVCGIYSCCFMGPVNHCITATDVLMNLCLSSASLTVPSSSNN